MIGVNQSTVSRWEQGLDLPARTLRGRLLRLARDGNAGRFDDALRWRVRTAQRPITLVGSGARFLEVSPAAGALMGIEPARLRGRSLYGLLGPDVDSATAAWEASGIFEGRIAMTMAVNPVPRATSSLFLRTEDMPYQTADGGIWCLCEISEIGAAAYQDFVSARGGRLVALSFDDIRA